MLVSAGIKGSLNFANLTSAQHTTEMLPMLKFPECEKSTSRNLHALLYNYG